MIFFFAKRRSRIIQYALRRYIQDYSILNRDITLCARLCVMKPFVNTMYTVFMNKYNTTVSL